MDKFGFHDVLREVCEIVKSKRFSSLNQIELADLWKDLTNFIHGRLSARKSVNFPGFGTFYIKRVRKDTDLPEDFCVPKFVPAKAWEKVTGYNKASPTVTGYGPAETVNFSSIAQDSGFARDDVEAGLKDIVHGLFRVLKKGKTIVLPFAALGRLYFQHREIRLRYYPEFLEALALKPSEKSEIPEDTPEPLEPSPLERVPLPALTTAEPAEKNDDRSKSRPQTSSKQQQPHFVLTDKAQQQLHRPQSPPHSDNVDALLSRGGTHTHPHSGNRLWSDVKCPICRQKNAPVVDISELIAKREKEQDRLLLHLSLEGDKEHLRRTKEIDELKLKAAITTAQYNYSKATETEVQRRSNNMNLPMGNPFENRPPPPDRIQQAKELREGLFDQMTIKKTRRLREKREKDLEDAALNSKFTKELKELEIYSHIEKLKRRKQQQEVLAEQIASQAKRNEQSSEPMVDNPFARSENLMFLYQKEKAKQLYQEQMAIIRQKKEYETRLADMDRQHSLDRLALSRKELEKDLHMIQRTNFNTRKSLENVWAQQKMEFERKKQIFC
ncbi:Coiled-coil domain-containing protein 81 [Irineochytrium annulatum]|nr:Coiled-coil domain-containing protein 81 [Irineochytrium annulatum]